MKARRLALLTRKQEMVRSGVVLRCEVCGWACAPFLVATKGSRGTRVQLHHVLPISFGGSDDAENLLALCPNHHATAHMLQLYTRSPAAVWALGAKTRDEILDGLRAVDRGERSWRAWRDRIITRRRAENEREFRRLGINSGVDDPAEIENPPDFGGLDGAGKGI